MRHISPRGAAALLTVALHVLLVSGLLVPAETPRAFVAEVAWVSPMQLVDVEPPPPEADDQAPVPLPGIRIEMPHVDLPAIEDPDPGAPASGVVASYARYLGEVTARIQHAWLVPSMEREQHCRLRIRLDSAGDVLAVIQEACDAEPRMQASITEAIRRAAPLPADFASPAISDGLLLDFAVSAADSSGHRSSIRPVTAAM